MHVVLALEGRENGSALEKVQTLDVARLGVRVEYKTYIKLKADHNKTCLSSQQCRDMTRLYIVIYLSQSIVDVVQRWMVTK